MADENPILNNPYEEPHLHYATNLQGELDYSRPVKGGRVFTPETRMIFMPFKASRWKTGRNFELP